MLQRCVQLFFIYLRIFDRGIGRALSETGQLQAAVWCVSKRRTARFTRRKEAQTNERRRK